MMFLKDSRKTNMGNDWIKSERLSLFKVVEVAEIRQYCKEDCVMENKETTKIGPSDK